MIILGVDTSGYSVSVALMRGRELLGEFTVFSKDLRNAVTLQPLIDSLMASCRMRLKDVELFAVANGPGSFTGIRSGLVTVKAMAYASGSMAIGVSSLRALARVAEEQGALVLPMFDARGGRVYASLYRDGKVCCSDEPRTIEALIQHVTPMIGEEERVIVTGNGLTVFEKEITDLPFITVRAPAERQVIRASAVAQLALEDLECGIAETDPFKLDAHYAIAPSAERQKQV